MKYLLFVFIFLAGCATVPPDETTAIFIDHYQGKVTNIHRDMNYHEGYLEHEKVSGIVDNGQWIELSRKPKRGLDAAEAGQIADVATSIAGVAAFDAVELNPFGVALLPLKYVANDYAEHSGQCRQWKPVLSGFGWAASAANIATIAGAGLGAVPVGLAAGFAAYQYLPGIDGCEWYGKRVAF